MLVCTDSAIVHLALLAGVKTAVLCPLALIGAWGRFEAPKSPWWNEAFLFAKAAVFRASKYRKWNDDFKSQRPKYTKNGSFGVGFELLETGSMLLAK